jgi:Lrp/AsnC family transcriptional regulator, regulator for asnA, asnC and gidA
MESTSAGGFQLDDLDLRIIAQLHDDGRKPSTEIARALGVPRTTVARRIERLVLHRVITIGVFADSRKIGLPIHVMIEVGTEPRRHEEVVAAVVAFDEVRWVGIATGPFDLLIEAMLRSDEHFRHFLLQKLAKTDGITRLQTAHILEVAKITFDWERMRRAGEASDPPVEDFVPSPSGAKSDGSVPPNRRHPP